MPYVAICTGETLGTGQGMSLQRGIPGIGEFQCYDKYMMADLEKHAEAVNEPEWSDVIQMHGHALPVWMLSSSSDAMDWLEAAL